jgi:hypothetical protein
MDVTMRRFLLFLMLAGMISSGFGCSVFRSNRQASPPTTVPLRVTNNNFQDMTIYVVRDGQRSRLGTVTATSGATFLLTERHLGQQGRVQLVADPLGTVGTIATEAFIVKPGQRVEWTIESDVRRSSLAIY